MAPIYKRKTTLGGVPPKPSIPRYCATCGEQWDFSGIFCSKCETLYDRNNIRRPPDALTAEDVRFLQACGISPFDPQDVFRREMKQLRARFAQGVRA